MFASGVSTPEVRVISWSRLTNGTWIPRFLAEVGLTLNTTAIGSFNGASLLAPHTISLIKGDAKILGEESSNHSNAWFIVDTVGSELIELVFHHSANASACNAIIGEV
jgi:hypothetical protein